jgi:hypothetical protein
MGSELTILDDDRTGMPDRVYHFFRLGGFQRRQPPKPL